MWFLATAVVDVAPVFFSAGRLGRGSSALRDPCSQSERPLPRPHQKF